MNVLLVLIARIFAKELPEQFRQIKWGKKAEEYERTEYETLKINCAH